MKRPPGYDKLQRAQRLRRDTTPQEKLLWGQLRGRRFEGFKFRRQMWLAGYIADFACAEARLVVEADGSQHVDNSEYDAQRERAFATLGWRTLRFWNNEVDENLEGVLTVIANALPSPSHRCAAGPSLSPIGRGEEAAPPPPSLSLQGRGTGAKRQGEGT